MSSSVAERLNEAEERGAERLLGRALYSEQEQARQTTAQRTTIGRLALRLAEGGLEAKSGLSRKIAACTGRLAIFDTLESSRSLYQRLLHEHQYSPYEKMLDFVSDVPELKRPGQEDMTDLLTRAGYMRLATGYGKTVLMSVLAREIGVGKESPHTGKKTRALIVVPRLNIMRQVVGTPDKGGFAKFAPEINVTTAYGQKQDLSGDAVVVTYKMLLSLAQEPTFFDDFDAIFFDEAHHAHGEQVSQVIKQIIKDKIAVGFSATPDSSEEKLLRDILPHEIDSISLREAIESDILRKARLYAFSSGQIVSHGKISHGDFSEKTLNPLRESEARNELILDLAKSFVEDGRQGIVSCIRGDSCAHAYKLAADLDGQEIYDKTLGHVRPIVARAVKGNDKDSETILAEFDAGRVDVIFYVDLLTEGWDSDRVGFVINGAPTASKRKAEQRMGRGTRPGRYEDTIYAEIIDFFRSAVRPVTMFDIMGESTIIQGLEIGSGRAGIAQKHSPPQKGSAADEDKMARHPLGHLKIDSIAAFRQLEGLLLDELIVEGTYRKDAPQGWTSLSRCSTHLSLSRDTLIALVDSWAEGRPKDDYRLLVSDGGSFSVWVAPDIADKLATYEEPPLAPRNYKNYPAAMLALSLSRDRLVSLIGRVQAKDPSFVVGTFKDRRTKKHLPHLSPQQIEKLARHKAEEEQVAALVPLGELANELGFPANEIANFLNGQGFPSVTKKVNEDVKPVRCFSREAAERARAYFNKPVPSDAEVVEDFARSIGMSPDEFSTYMKSNRYLSMIEVARFKDPETGSGVKVAFLPRVHVEYLRNKQAQPAWSRPRAVEPLEPQLAQEPTTPREVSQVRRARRDMALKEYSFQEIMDTLPQADLGHVSEAAVRSQIAELRTVFPGAFWAHRGEKYSVEFMLEVIRRLKRRY